MRRKLIKAWTGYWREAEEKEKPVSGNVTVVVTSGLNDERDEGQKRQSEVKDVSSLAVIWY